jgi:hypothetical protein
VLGGLALNFVNAWAGAAFRPGTPADLPQRAVLQIEAGATVCWGVSLGLGRGRDSGCGDATYELKPQRDDHLTYPLDTRFFAAIQRTYEKKLRGKVTIVLFVDGQEVDRASTSYDSASVGY